MLILYFYSKKILSKILEVDKRFVEYYQSRKSFSQQLHTVLKLISEYTLTVTSAEELTKAETYT